MPLFKYSATVLITAQLCFAFSLNDITKIATDTLQKDSKETQASTSAKSSDDLISSGLKEALTQGVKIAVDGLGQNNGYLNNPDVKIPLPESLQSSEALLRKVGAGNYADDLIKVMNQAASTAAPKTASIFIDTINNMSIDDANKILNGSNTAATSYFKTHAYEQLKNMVAPIVKQTIASNDVATYYNAFNAAYKTYGKDLVENSGVMGYAKSFGVDKFIPGSEDESLDEYITNKALDGLFTMIEKEEAAIRANPVNRTTDLLKQVFK